MVQVETKGALDDLKGIASTPGVDVLFVGPRDLTQALGCPGDTRSEVFQSALEAVITAAHEAGIAAGILASRPEDVEHYSDRGFRFIGVGSDSSLLASIATTAAQSASHRQQGSVEAIE